MATNQEGRHAAFRAIGSTTGTYNQDAIAAMILEGAAAGTFNEVMVSWLKIRTASSQNNLTDLQNLFASQLGFTNWNAISTFAANFTDPTEITGLVLWYDLTNVNFTSLPGLSNNDPITAIEDGSDSENDASQATETKQPTYTTASGINSLPAAIFDGTSDFMDCAFVLDPAVTDFTAIVVANVGANASAKIMLQQLNGTGTGKTFFNSNTSEVLTTTIGDGLSAGATFGDQFFTLKLDGTALSLFIDGVVTASTTTSTPTASDGGLRIGASKAESAFFNGVIAEIIIYDKALSASETTNINNYIKTKFNIT